MTIEDANLIENQDNIELEIETEEDGEAIEEEELEEGDEENEMMSVEKKVKRNKSSQKAIKNNEE